jgi:iron complex transport system ATP-binding protein
MIGIKVTGVTVSYNGTPALADSDLTVAMGEWVALIGPNGAGKSTLLRAVAGTAPYTGEIEIVGRPAASLSRRARSRRVAVVPQSPVLPEDMTAGEYVLLGRTPHLGYWAAESRHDLEVAAGALHRLEGDDLADRRLGRLSGGERQRVVLARALAQESPVLLLDEPTTALDIGHQQTVLDLVQGLRRERRIAVLSAVHDLTMAAQYADRLVLLDGGKVVAEGRPGAVLTEENLARFPGARVSVLHGPDGSLIVAPRRDPASLPRGDGAGE